jgi:hypothetical protein
MEPLNGAGHYREAERLLNDAARIAHEGEPQTYWYSEQVQGRVQAAAVHAQLATAAALLGEFEQGHDT